MSNSTLTLNLNKLIVHKLSEQDGDEVFLKCNDEKIFPEDQKFVEIVENEIKVNTAIALEGLGKWVEVELWEYDFVLPNKLLGTFKIFADTKGGPFTADLKADADEQARYSLTWEINSKLLKTI